MSKVSVPNPCPKSNASLKPITNSTNQWCTNCATEIIDFTEKSTDQIIDYLNAKNGERVCGILKDTSPSYYNYWQWTKGQYHRINHSFTGVTKWAFITLLILTFGLSSCTKKPQNIKKGKVKVNHDHVKGKMVIGEMKYVDSTALKVILLLLSFGLASCIKHQVVPGYVKANPSVEEKIKKV